MTSDEGSQPKTEPKDSHQSEEVSHSTVHVLGRTTADVLGRTTADVLGQKHYPVTGRCSPP